MDITDPGQSNQDTGPVGVAQAAFHVVFGIQVGLYRVVGGNLLDVS